MKEFNTKMRFFGIKFRDDRKKIVDALTEKVYKVAGFLAPGKFDNNERAEFTIVNLKNNESHLLCTNKVNEDLKKIGRFYFNEEGLKFGKEILKPENLKDADFIFIDELGPFELKGKGWSSSLEELLKNPENNLICLVRKNLVYDILRRFGITDAIIFDISEDTVDDLIEKIKE